MIARRQPCSSAALCYYLLVRQFFTPNIDIRGRLVRAALGIALLAGGWVAHVKVNDTLAVLLIISGGFACFEAARGWCVARACGIRTKL